MAKKVNVTQVMLQELFDYWLELGLMQHRNFDADMKRRAKARLQDYSVGELKEFMLCYSVIWKGEQYWYTHKWSFEEFMLRGFKKFRPEYEPYKHFLKREDDGFFGSPSGEGESTPPDSSSPSPALKRKRDRFLIWDKATPEERKELAKEWGYIAVTED